MSLFVTKINHASGLTLSALAMLFMMSCSSEGSSTENSMAFSNTSSTMVSEAVLTRMVESPNVIFETSEGTFTVSLNAEKAPTSVDNFLQYVEAGHYDNTIFHRVIDNFMIQGGGFNIDMTQKTTRAPILNEADNGLENKLGTIAMARTNAPHSATSQFFINVKNNRSLNHRGKSARGWGYAVFGEVTEGISVVEAIKAVPTGRQAEHQNVPLDPVIIQRIYIANSPSN